MPSDPQPAPDAADWRPRSQAPATSYTSFRELREQVRRETGQQRVVLPPPPAPDATATRPTEAVPAKAPTTGQRPAIIVLPSDSGSGKLATGQTSAVGATTGPTPTIKMGTPTVHIRPDAPRKAGTEGNARTPTTQQRISAIITAVVGIIAIVVLVLRPFVAAHLPPSFAAGAAGFTTPPTPLPVYPPIGLDTDHPAPLIWATSGVVMDESNGAILFSKNGDVPLAMASTTKLMTAVVALSHGSPDELITITPNAASIFCTCVGIKAGERYSLHDLLYGMLMISGNDAAEAIAEGVGGNEATFIKWMNDTAGALGLTHSHYMNPHGLDDDGHYSSARDLAVLGRYALQLPTIAGILGTRYFTIPATASHPKHGLVNQHQPLWWYPGADGGKPGWTGAARFVDILSAVRNGHHLIAVIMHSDNDWVTDIRDMLNWGFNDFTWVSPQDVLSRSYIPYADSYSNFTWDVPSRIVNVDSKEYFPYTGYILAGAFLTYFNGQGGINHFGFPRGMPTPAASGQLTQHFDKIDITCNPASGVCSG